MIDEAAALDTWEAAYENIMRTLGFDADEPSYFAEVMESTANDQDIIQNWNKATSAQRLWMVTKIVSFEVEECYERRLANSKSLVDRLKNFLNHQKREID